MIRFATAAFIGATAALPAFADVDIQAVTSDGGIKAWLVEEHSLPFVAIEISFLGGTSLDVEGKRGAINLMTGLLEEGSGDLDARAFARAGEELATSFGFSSGPDSLTVSARFLTENFDASVALLRDVLQSPRFDDADVERVRAQVISGLAFDEKDPNDIASRTFAQMAYGDHPYGSVDAGTPESVAALTRDDLFEAHKNVLVRDRVLVGASGDITPEQLGALVDTLLEGLPESGPALPPKVEPQISGGTTVVDFETPQSVALFGQRGIAVDDDDYFAAIILNQVLGGGSFESRLMNEVREKRGLTYGVYSYLSPRDLANSYMGSVSSANDRIAEAIEVIRDQWRLAAEEGLTEEEVQDAKTYLTGSYPLRFDGNGTIAGILVGMQSIGLDPEYVKTRNARVDRVTTEEVKRVAAELLDPDALHFVVVGQPEGLASE
ncbi:M16 family metallopeptidase [Sulfitobacter donghicola]|uniref:Zinc protease n=1 Tax=Sulfitobacter donghicola DSW-25 = KCTC 12864 = JCM 14565 TaxID=1300350 RepID=A0A073ILA6_9RHOB|nr:pitrilysin family protein [Sulfitobacter donghicola]KEJ90375.1 zinc protease [Sulfitobacter donghicola DSW-25 = KCTC 12864 = JCM 14565]KIN67602.1 putative zinc protease [Sulfitobacter donghicola DSW-25 = KCTC 12864 = JCM 14565]